MYLPDDKEAALRQFFIGNTLKNTSFSRDVAESHAQWLLDGCKLGILPVPAAFERGVSPDEVDELIETKDFKDLLGCINGAATTLLDWQQVAHPVVERRVTGSRGKLRKRRSTRRWYR